MFGLVAALALTACSSSTGTTSSSPSSAGSTASSGFADGGALAPAGANGGRTAHGIKCETAEQLQYHIHAHLAVFVKGTTVAIPGDIGIYDNTCIFWLHTHDDSGILHIESPDSRVFTLGDFFAVWGQPLSSTQVGPQKGAVTAWVDGKPFSGDPATIKLELHTTIQLDVGTATPGPQPYTFPDGV